MKPFTFSISLSAASCLALALSLGVAQAQSFPNAMPGGKPLPVVIPSPPSIAAKSWILMDANSGVVIAEHEADKRLPPASLTKLMTAYLVEKEISEGRLSVDDTVRVSEKAWRKGGSKMFIEVDKHVAIGDLLKGIVVVSGNDASIAVAEHLAGSEEAFSGIANEQARQMGMHNTHFKNATGWPDEGHYSSARDKAILSQHIINDYPQHYDMYSMKEFTFNGIKQPNRNQLLRRDESVDGLKTGWTQDAGYGLAASAKRGDMRLISVIFGAASSESRAQETQKLLSYGFRYYDTLPLLEAGSLLGSTRVWGGRESSVGVVVPEPIVLTVPRDKKEQVEHRLKIEDGVKAPVTQGDTLGKIEVVLDGKVLTEQDLVAMENVKQGSWFKRFFDGFRRFFHGMFN